MHCSVHLSEYKCSRSQRNTDSARLTVRQSARDAFSLLSRLFAFEEAPHYRVMGFAHKVRFNQRYRTVAAVYDRRRSRISTLSAVIDRRYSADASFACDFVCKASVMRENSPPNSGPSGAHVWQMSLEEKWRNGIA